MLLISLLVILAVFITGISIYLRMQQQFEETQMNSVAELTQMTNNYIDQYLFTINNLLVVASESGLLASADKEELSLFFERQLVLSEDFINSIFFIDDVGDMYGYPQLVLDFLPQDTRDKLYPFQNLTMYGQTEPFDFPVLGKTVTIYRKIWDPRTRDFVGVLAVNIQPDEILKKVEAYNSSLNRSIILFTHTGKLIGQNMFKAESDLNRVEKEPLVRRLIENLDQYATKRVQEYEHNGTPYVSALSNHNSFAWNVLVMVSQKELYEQNRETRFFFIVYLVGASLFGLLIGYLFSSYLSNPLLKLVNQMRRVARGDLSQRIQTHQQDEIGFLTRQYNVMLDRLTELMELSVTKENAKREAELKMYQAQINPHFLYNTLNSIQWMARMKRMNEVDRAVAELVPMLQYSLKKGALTSLGEELSQLERYGALQSIRYRGSISIRVKVGPGVRRSEYCPRMILQPLVENAIYHGLEARPGGGMASVRVERVHAGDGIRIRVIDNGVGMSADKVKDLEEQWKEHPDEDRYRGMVNVASRLHYVSGTIRCWSRRGLGTVIEMTWERGLGRHEGNNA
ncbi:cache domain-containing sensor histidine kinase [Paenibacillus agaridevorans]|uniref:cache domain-containing sensor histidine kinase n=1 Tax=Paenibacillus agaridevorans TaxID=171404 RepID=UPI001FEBA26F|nr:sensor histidine kinase [Paenibacillus agaridevorans]